ncbi:unnamed protein product, partial [Penicillium nalgiovense]
WNLQTLIATSGLENKLFISACATSPVTSGWENLLSYLDTDPTMGRIRKTPPPGSAEGDTTEEESSLQENGSFGNHHNDTAVEDGQESPLHTWSMGPRPEEELEQPGQANLAEDYNMVALQYAVDDLEDIRSRLAVVETSIEMMAKEGKTSTIEDNTTRQTLRS